MFKVSEKYLRPHYGLQQPPFLAITVQLFNKVVDGLVNLGFYLGKNVPKFIWSEKPTDYFVN